MTEKFYGDFEKFSVAELRKQLHLSGVQYSDSTKQWGLVGMLRQIVNLGDATITAAASAIKVTFFTFDIVPPEPSSAVERIDVGPEANSFLSFY